MLDSIHMPVMPTHGASPGAVVIDRETAIRIMQLAGPAVPAAPTPAPPDALDVAANREAAVRMLCRAYDHGIGGRVGMDAVLEEVKLNPHIYIPGIFANWAAEVNAVRANGNAALAEMTASRDAAIGAMNDAVSEVTKLREDLRLANEECAEKQAIIETFEGGERAADAAIETLKKSMAQAADSLAERNARIAALCSELEKTRSALSSRDAIISGYRAELACKDEALAAAHRRKAHVDEAHKRALHAIDELRAEVERMGGGK